MKKYKSNLNNDHTSKKTFLYHLSRQSSSDQPLDELFEQFWKFEAEATQLENGSSKPVDQEALDILNKTISYNGERYEIGLPLKNPLRIEKIILQLSANWKVFIYV